MEIAGVGLASAFLAGLISFLSPCVLPLVPGYLSYVAGQPYETLAARRATHANAALLSLSVLFVLGFSTVFVALGASATALSRLLLGYREEASIAGGIIVIVFGLFMTGLLRAPWMLRELRLHPRVRPAGPLAAYVLGVAFAFGWTPCIGPVLGAILTVSATSATATSGVTLLAVYSLGLGVPFIAAALFTGRMVAWSRRFARSGARLQIAAGVLMILMGIAMITGQLTVLAYWLLRTFPALATIG